MEEIKRKIKEYFKGLIDTSTDEEVTKILEYNKAIMQIIDEEAKR